MRSEFYAASLSTSPPKRPFRFEIVKELATILRAFEFTLAPAPTYHFFPRRSPLKNFLRFEYIKERLVAGRKLVLKANCYLACMKGVFYFIFFVSTFGLLSCIPCKTKLSNRTNFFAHVGVRANVLKKDQWYQLPLICAFRLLS